MNLQNLFSRDIKRSVNPAVVVGAKDTETIKIEIEEYVFTKDLIDELYTFLNDIFNKQEGKTGIWIDGFYGSGKSHFLKYIYYCIDSETSESAFAHYKKCPGNGSRIFRCYPIKHKTASKEGSGFSN